MSSLLYVLPGANEVFMCIHVNIKVCINRIYVNVLTCKHIYVITKMPYLCKTNYIIISMKLHLYNVYVLQLEIKPCIVYVCMHIHVHVTCVPTQNKCYGK